MIRQCRLADRLTGRASGSEQITLFSDSISTDGRVARQGSTSERLDPLAQVRSELEILGIAVTAHPLSFYRPLLAQRGVITSSALASKPNGTYVRVAGLIVSRQTPPTKSRQRIIFTTMDDKYGLMDCTVFPSVQQQYASTVMSATALVIEGTLRKTGVNGLSINVRRAYSLEEWLRATGVTSAR